MPPPGYPGADAGMMAHDYPSTDRHHHRRHHKGGRHASPYSSSSSSDSEVNEELERLWSEISRLEGNCALQSEMVAMVSDVKYQLLDSVSFLVNDQKKEVMGLLGQLRSAIRDQKQEAAPPPPPVVVMPAKPSAGKHKKRSKKRHCSSSSSSFSSSSSSSSSCSSRRSHRRSSRSRCYSPYCSGRSWASVSPCCSPGRNMSHRDACGHLGPPQLYTYKQYHPLSQSSSRARKIMEGIPLPHMPSLPSGPPPPPTNITVHMPPAQHHSYSGVPVVSGRGNKRKKKRKSKRHHGYRSPLKSSHNAPVGFFNMPSQRGAYREARRAY